MVVVAAKSMHIPTQEWSENLAESGKIANFPAIYYPLGEAYTEAQWAHLLIQIPVEDILVEAKSLLHSPLVTLDTLTNLSKNHTVAWMNQSQHFYGNLMKSQEHQLRELIKAVEKVSEGLLSRQRRSWSFNLDLTSAIGSVFNGINNLIHAPTLRELRHNVTNIFKTIEKSARFQRNLARALGGLGNGLNTLEKHEKELREAFHSWADMEEMKDALLGLATVVDKISKNELSSDVLMPGEAEGALQEAETYAKARGLNVPLTSFFEVYNLPVSYITTKSNWYLLLHFPMVRKTAALKAYEFIAYPSFVEGRPIQIAHPSGLVAVSQGLESDATSIFDANFRETCRRFGKTWLCQSSIVQRSLSTNCPAQILRNVTHSCKFEEIDMEPQPVWKEGLLTCFFMTKTDISITCPGSPAKLQRDMIGRYNIQLDTGCSAKTEDWFFTAPLSSEAIGSMEIKNVSLSPTSVQARMTEDQTQSTTRLEEEIEDLRIQMEEDEDRFEDWIDDHEDSDTLEWTSIAINSTSMMVVLAIVITLIVKACRIPQA